MKKTIGFIGLGSMGKPMAKNVLKAGFPIHVYDCVNKPVAELSELGATPANSPKEVAQTSDIVIIMVRDAPQVREVILGNAGIIEGIKKGCTGIIMSTIEATVVRELGKTLAQKGVRLIDAPVTRGQQAAIDGTLAIYVGGDKEVFEECREVLKTMGTDIYHCGDLGTGEVVKITNNYIDITSCLILAEAMVLGVKGGVEPARLIELVTAGGANSFNLQYYWGPRVLQGNFKPGFDLDLALKDMGVAVSLARDIKVPITLGSAAYQIYLAESAAGKGKMDYLIPVTTLERLAGVEVRSRK